MKDVLQYSFSMSGKMGGGGGREGGIPEASLVSISKIFKDYLHICIAVHALFSI